HLRLDRLPRRHQDQHPPRRRQDGMAAPRPGSNRLPDELPARPPHRHALLDARNPKGFPPHLTAGSELSEPHSTPARVAAPIPTPAALPCPLPPSDRAYRTALRFSSRNHTAARRPQRSTRNRSESPASSH